jgi:prolipoprotein diacylglyceryltransferase
VYVGGYGLGRLWVESLRIDPANRILGWRINEWVSLLAVVAAAAILLLDSRRSPEAESSAPNGEGAEEPDPADSTS